MEHEVREEHGLAVAAFSGDIDFNSSPDARRIMLDLVDRKTDLMVDMSSVEYIDSSGVASLIEAFQSAMLDLVDRKTDLMVDMSSVEYIDSSGVASLIEAFQSAKGTGCRFGLVAVSAPALRVLQLAHLEKVLPIYETMADAASPGG